jgi:uncharacterized protein YkwD
MPAMGTTAAMQPCIDTAETQRALDLLNATRERGVACAGSVATSAPRRPLVLDTRLSFTAQEQAADLARRDTLSHVDAQQRSFKARLALGGYDTEAAGENLAAGQPDFSSTLQAWMDSPTHCTTLMTPAFSEVGLACMERSGSRYERFWVAHLGVPRR